MAPNQHSPLICSRSNLFASHFSQLRNLGSPPHSSQSLFSSAETCTPPPFWHQREVEKAETVHQPLRSSSQSEGFASVARAPGSAAMDFTQTPPHNTRISPSKSAPYGLPSELGGTPLFERIFARLPRKGVGSLSQTPKMPTAWGWHPRFRVVIYRASRPPHGSAQWHFFPEGSHDKVLLALVEPPAL